MWELKKQISREVSVVFVLAAFSEFLVDNYRSALWDVQEQTGVIWCVGGVGHQTRVQSVWRTEKQGGLRNNWHAEVSMANFSSYWIAKWKNWSKVQYSFLVLLNCKMEKLNQKYNIHWYKILCVPFGLKNWNQFKCEWQCLSLIF